MGGPKTRTRGGKTLSSGRTAPLKPKPGLSGPPVRRCNLRFAVQSSQEPRVTVPKVVFGCARLNYRIHWARSLPERELVHTFSFSIPILNSLNDRGIRTHGCIFPSFNGVNTCVELGRTSHITSLEQWPFLLLTKIT